MKSRTMHPLESPDTPYITRSMRKASEEYREPLPQYKTSLTPPSFPSELAPDSATKQNLARAEMDREDVARREQILALAEERALFEAAEQIKRAKTVKLAEEALIRTREEVALKSKTPGGKSRSHENNVDHRDDHAVANQEHLQIETEGSRSPQDSQGAVESEPVGNPVTEAGQLLSRLTKQTADFAALAETVTELHRQLTEERTRHEATARSQMDELHGRETALAQRESEAVKRIQDERHALESRVAALDARETALEEKRLAFNECRRKFRETFSSLMED